jgi:hydrogenase nickel incorporation protein HypB
MFLKADFVLITKIDLLPYLPDVQIDRIADALGHVMPRPRYLPVSARTGEGIDQWLAWMETQRPSVMHGAEQPTHAYPGSP